MYSNLSSIKKYKSQITILGFFLVSIFSLTACGDQLKETLEVQQAELMELHDEVMPKSMRIDKIKEQLYAFSQENKDSDSLSVLIMDTSLKLQKANDDMYLWMKNFGTAMNDVSDLKERKVLYDELLPEIERIKTETDEQIEKAKAILGN